MKLISLHIENFGNLSNFDYRFTDGLNKICEENGFGKTTLGAFIKVMLYGFENDGKRKENERKKYEPWKGGTYGGKIIFEVEGHTYILNRGFGANLSKDHATLRDASTRVETTDYDINNLGKAIFKIDAGSFARTMLISQNSYSHGDVSDIDSKIGNLVDHTDDLNNYSKADLSLENAIKAIDSKNGLKGKRERRNQLKDEIKAKKGIEQAIDKKGEKSKELEELIADQEVKINELETQITAVSKVKDLAKKKVEYDGIMNHYQPSRENYITAKAYFPGNIPAITEVAYLLEKSNYITRYETSMLENSLSEKESVRLKELNSQYPADDDLQVDYNQVEKDIAAYNQCKKRLVEEDLTKEERIVYHQEKEVFSNGYDIEETDSLIQNWKVNREHLKEKYHNQKLSEAEEENLTRLTGIYGNHQLDLNRMDNLRSDWVIKRKKALEQVSKYALSILEEEELAQGKVFDENPVDLNTLDSMKQLWVNRDKMIRGTELASHNGTVNNTGSIVLLAVGMGLFILGIVLMIIKSSIILFIISAIGVLFIAGGIISKSSNQRKILEHQKEIIKIEDLIKGYLAKYHIPYNENEVLFDLRELNSQSVRYHHLAVRKKEYIQKSKEADEIISDTNQRAKAFCRQFHIEYQEDNFIYDLDTIKDTYYLYCDLVDRKNYYSAQKVTIQKRIEDIEQETYRYLAFYGYSQEESDVVMNLNRLQDRYQKYLQLSKKDNSVFLKKDQQQLAQLADSIQNFFIQFTSTEIAEENYSSAFAKIKEEITIRKQLSIKEHNYQEAKKNLDELIREIKAFLVHYQLIPKENLNSQLNEIENHVNDYSLKEKIYLDSKNSKEKFEKNYPDYAALADFEDPYDDHELTTLNIQQKENREYLEMLKKENNNLYDDLEHLNDQYDELCDKEGMLEGLEEEITELEANREKLVKARELLKKAKERLNAKYTAPLEKYLSYYFGILGEKADFKIEIDSNRQLIINTNGVERNEAVLSEGYQDVVDICYRFALIGAMYPDEKPLIILDDPFINLDQDKITKGLQLLDEVASHYQILYLTCHESRL